MAVLSRINERIWRLLLLLIPAALCACSRVPLTTPAAPDTGKIIEPQVISVPESVESVSVSDVPQRFTIIDPLTDSAEGKDITKENGSSKTTISLCEPVDSRRPYPTVREQAETKKLIRKTCAALGVSRETCKYFVEVSLRESSYRYWVRHKKKGDTSAAVRGWIASANTYGWQVEWPYRSQLRADLSAIVMRPVRSLPNPYYPDVERWLTGGLGLGGLNVGYHLAKFDPMAPPEILCDPVVNVMVQVSIARSAVDRYGAKNLYEVQAIYGGRIYKDRHGRARPLSCSRGCPKDLQPDNPKHAAQRKRARYGDAKLRKRCLRKKIDCMASPSLGSVLRAPATPVAARYALADRVRGGPLPPFDTPRGVTETPPQVLSE